MSFEVVLRDVGNGSFSFTMFVLLADCQRGEKLERNQSSLNPIVEKEELILLIRCSYLVCIIKAHVKVPYIKIFPGNVEISALH